MKTYRITQREVIINVFHIEAKSKAEARRKINSSPMRDDVVEAMSYGEQETESVETLSIEDIDAED